MKITAQDIKDALSKLNDSVYPNQYRPLSKNVGEAANEANVTISIFTTGLANYLQDYPTVDVAGTAFSAEITIGIIIAESKGKE